MPEGWAVKTWIRTWSLNPFWFFPVLKLLLELGLYITWEENSLPEETISATAGWCITFPCCLHKGARKCGNCWEEPASMAVCLNIVPYLLPFKDLKKAKDIPHYKMTQRHIHKRCANKSSEGADCGIGIAGHRTPEGFSEWPKTTEMLNKNSGRLPVPPHTYWRRVCIRLQCL